MRAFRVAATIAAMCALGCVDLSNLAGGGDAGVAADAGADSGTSLSLVIDPATLSITAGAAASIAAEVRGRADATTAVTITVSKLPTGISATPLVLTGASKGTIELSVAAAAALGSSTVDVVAISGAASATTSFVLTVRAPPGTLDTSFGQSGFATGGASPPYRAAAFAQQADGNIVIGGCDNVQASTMIVQRVRPDASPDTAFGTAGTTKTKITPTSADCISALAPAPGGRIVSVGSTVEGGAGAFAIVRYGADGAADASFGSGGKTSSQPAGRNPTANAVAVAPDGSIVALGGALDNPGFPEMVVGRYLASGLVDTTFGANGGLVVPAAGSAMPSAVALQGDGKIVVLGTTFGSGPTFFASRFTAGGTLDPAFGVGGMAKGTFGPGTQVFAAGLALLAAGKVLVSGRTNSGKGSYLEQFTAAGSADTSFGVGGVAASPAPTQNTMAVLPDGTILLGGSSAGMFALARFDATGAVDKTFGKDGIVITPLPAGAAGSVAAIFVQADGRILAAGPLNGTGWAIARYWP